MKPDVLLSPDDMMHINMTWLQHSLLSIDQTIAGITNLTHIQSSKVPELNAHIKNLTDSDEDWGNSVKPKIQSVMSLTVSYCSTIEASIDGIKTLLETSKSLADKDALDLHDKEIRNILQPLNILLKEGVIPEAISTAQVLTDFHETAISIVRDLKLDFDIIQQAIQTDQADVAYAQKQLNDVSKKLSEAKETKKRLEDPCLNVVTLGIAEIANLIGGYGAQVDEYQSQVNQYMSQTAQDKQELASLTLLIGTLASYLQGSNLISSSGNAIFTFLKSVSTQLQSALDSDESFDPDDSWANEDLDYIKQQWKDISNRILQPEKFSLGGRI